MSDPAPHVCEQIDSLRLDPARPLILCDADEVILQFVAGLEAFLTDEGYDLVLRSFRLHGNIFHRDSGEAAADETVSQLLTDFYAERQGLLEPVTGAPEALAGLSARAQIVILTNVALSNRPRREANLAQHGLAYPVIANEGVKGPAAARLSRGFAAPVFFLDDIPHNIVSVRAEVPQAVCIHVVADPRLAALLEPADGSDHRADRWDEIARLIHERLDTAGF